MGDDRSGARSRIDTTHERRIKWVRSSGTMYRRSQRGNKETSISAVFKAHKMRGGTFDPQNVRDTSGRSHLRKAEDIMVALLFFIGIAPPTNGHGGANAARAKELCWCIIGADERSTDLIVGISRES